MTLVDKIQGTLEKLTNDDTRMTAAEVTTVQQAYNAMQLGWIKNTFYIQQAQSADVKEALRELGDEFLKPNLEKPRRMMEKAGIPYLDLHAHERVQNMTQTNVGVYRDEEILLDSVLSMQATVAGLQAGALAAVRGDVRDFFLSTRDQAFEQWRKLGLLTMKKMPQAIPPTMSGVTA